MTTLNPISGPITPEELKALALEPYGVALKTLRKHDPFFGRAPGEKIRFEVIAEATVSGGAIVMAESLADAKSKADNLKVSDFEWDNDHDLDRVLQVTPI